MLHKYRHVHELVMEAFSLAEEEGEDEEMEEAEAAEGKHDEEED